MGTIGSTYSLIQHKHFSATLPFGVGLGCGGYRYDETKSDAFNHFNCADGLAYGSYTGFDVGYRFGRVVGLYQGNRLEFSKTTDLPITYMGLHVLGLQFDISKHFRWALESGAGWFSNDVDSREFWMNSTSITFHW